MKCPECGFEVHRPEKIEGTLRKYKCWKCQHRFETVEIMKEELGRIQFRARLYTVLLKRRDRGDDAV